jgi:hypothetical protein
MCGKCICWWAVKIPFIEYTSAVGSICKSMQPRQEGSERFAQQMTPSSLPNGSVRILFLEISQTPLEIKWTFTNLFSGVFDLKSSRFLFVTSYTICHMPLRLTKCPASKQ